MPTVYLGGGSLALGRLTGSDTSSNVLFGGLQRINLTPLMRAAWGKDAAAVLELLIARGADVNAVNKDGVTALIKAAWSGCGENLEVLLEHGADPEVRDTWGQTALDVAERFRNRTAAAFLRSRKT